MSKKITPKEAYVWGDPDYWEILAFISGQIQTSDQKDESNTNKNELEGEKSLGKIDIKQITDTLKTEQIEALITSEVLNIPLESVLDQQATQHFSNLKIDN